MADETGFRNDWLTKDFYQVLGVGKDATADEIKKAYRKLARANHPDSNPGDTAKHDTFKSVAEAYDVVGDPDKRKKYDEMRAARADGRRLRGAGGGAAGSTSTTCCASAADRPAAASATCSATSSAAASPVAPAPRPTAPPRAADVETSATISFTDAMDGVTISLRLTSDSACPTCSGTGGKPGTKPHICPQCEGAGFVVSSVGGAFSLNETCPACGGRQLVYDEACPTCHGSGRGLSARTIQARIPMGVKDGQRIRLRGKGGCGRARRPGRRPLRHRQGQPAPAVRPQGRQPRCSTYPSPSTRPRWGRTSRSPRSAGRRSPSRSRRARPTAAPSGSAGKGARKSDGTFGDLLATVEVQVPAHLDATAREAVEAYRAATSGKPLRANLFEAS